MTIDAHAHWRPPALIEALRERRQNPRIRKNISGVDVLLDGTREIPITEAFDNIEIRLAEMDKHNISTEILSLLSAFTWIERLPLDSSIPLVELYNNSMSEICKNHEGRFAAFASLPLADIAAAALEFERALGLPGIVGAQVPGNAFLTLNDANVFSPILEVANKNRAVIFIHFGPRPGDSWPRVPKNTDNLRRRIGTLDMQASLSSNMVTLCMTEFLEPYPNAKILLHNLGGNIPYEVERMDHRCLLDTPEEQLPSKRFMESKVFVDCNSLGPRAIEAGVRAYGEARIVFGTDGTVFGGEWSNKAVTDAKIGDVARYKILYQNAANMFGDLVPLTTHAEAAE